MARREFLQLADTFNPSRHKIAGWMISEKLDGTRCFWDGGMSRGCRTEDVPWASILHPKTGARKDKIKPYATGLWSRYGNPIIAPDSFLNQLPACPLDGELWAGRENFQLCRSICAGDDPDPRFHLISYAVYSTPALPLVFSSGEIKNANMLKDIDHDAVEKWAMPLLRDLPDYNCVEKTASFNDELMFLREVLETQNDVVFMHQQTKLPEDEQAAREAAEAFLEKVLDNGGEGVVIRDPNSTWTPKRHKGLLKYKPYEDAEAVIIGFRAGKEGKQGNVLGKIGTLVVRTTSLENAVEFEIGSGLKMHEREITPGGEVGHKLFAEKNPGELMPATCTKTKHFRVGETITFKYRELSDDCIPKEGRYWRKRDAE